VSILVADTQVKHSLASSAYNTRREECERAVEILRGSLPEIRALRDVSSRDIEEHGHLLPDPILRRARHVVTENARVIAAVDALRRGDLQTVGRLFVESHRSLQHDYEVSVQELDLLVDTAIGQPGVYGARMTGGGFGGSIVALVDDSHLTRVQTAMRDAYVARFVHEPGFLVTRGGAGVCEIA
jgi:galactokinase